MKLDELNPYLQRLIKVACNEVIKEKIKFYWDKLLNKGDK